MNIFAVVLRFWSILFALAVGLFSAGVALVLLISGSSNYRFDMLPWFDGSSALWALLLLGLLGVFSAVLAFTGKAKPLLALFCLCALILMAYGYFLSPKYRFDGSSEAYGALALAFGALGATFGALMALKKQRA